MQKAAWSLQAPLQGTGTGNAEPEVLVPAVLDREGPCVVQEEGKGIVG